MSGGGPPGWGSGGVVNGGGGGSLGAAPRCVRGRLTYLDVREKPKTAWAPV